MCLLNLTNNKHRLHLPYHALITNTSDSHLHLDLDLDLDCTLLLKLAPGHFTPAAGPGSSSLYIHTNIEIATLGTCSTKSSLQLGSRSVASARRLTAWRFAPVSASKRCFRNSASGYATTKAGYVLDTFPRCEMTADVRGAVELLRDYATRDFAQPGPSGFHSVRTRRVAEHLHFEPQGLLESPDPHCESTDGMVSNRLVLSYGHHR